MRVGNRLRRALLLAILATAVMVPGVASAQQDPEYSVSEADLAAALDCPDFTSGDTPVLLVHGTFTTADEQWSWSYQPVLEGMGFDVCKVTYPDRGFGDQQVSAEYIAYAVQQMAARSPTGRVDLIGHSQGASMPRWAVRFWPSVAAAIDDYVALAGPHHGTIVALTTESGGTQRPAAFYQLAQGSEFVRILNEGDETPGSIDWTNIYTQMDELIQPFAPVPTAALDWQAGNPAVSNILLQDLCPLLVVDHITIGTVDQLTFDMAVDALTNDGPADPARLDLDPVTCNVPGQIVNDPAALAAFTTLVTDGIAGGLPGLHLTDAEPATMPYALPAAENPDPEQEPEPQPAPPAAPEAEEPGGVAAPPATTSLPRTGGAGVIAVLGAALVAVTRRAG